MGGRETEVSRLGFRRRGNKKKGGVPVPVWPPRETRVECVLPPPPTRGSKGRRVIAAGARGGRGALGPEVWGGPFEQWKGLSEGRPPDPSPLPIKILLTFFSLLFFVFCFWSYLQTSSEGRRFSLGGGTGDGLPPTSRGGSDFHPPPSLCPASSPEAPPCATRLDLGAKDNLPRRLPLVVLYRPPGCLSLSTSLGPPPVNRQATSL